MNRIFAIRVLPLIVCLLLSCVTLTAQAEDTSVELGMHEGKGKTIVVRIINLTPYQMTFVPADSSFSESEQAMNKDKFKTKHFLFAPLGVPKIIPAVNADSIPYPVIFAFKDGKDGFPDKSGDGSMVTSAEARWLVNNVPNVKPGAPDPRFIIKVHRDVPEKNQSSLFPLVASCVSEAITVAEASYTGSPFTWAQAVVGAGEVYYYGNKFSEENSKEKDGIKVYVSSYIIGAPPGNGMPATTPPPGTTNASADDAVVTQQAPINGYAESSLVVTSQVLRKPVPQVTVTVMTFDLYTAAATKKTLQEHPAASPGGKQLQQSLERRGAHGLTNLLELVKSLSREQKEELVAAADALAQGRKLSLKQETLLAKLADAHKRQAKSLDLH